MNNFLKNSLVVALLGGLLPSSTAAQNREQSEHWQELQAIDQAFAERSNVIGRTQAFLEVLGLGSVVFREGPVDAQELYSSESIPNSSLTWRAHYIDVSRSGDLGISAGPYRITSSDDEDQQFFGHLISIWRKDTGEWVLMADVAVGIPGYLSLDVSANIEDFLPIVSETAHPAMAGAESNNLQSLIEADNLFGRSINFRGGQRALLRFGLENTRVYLPGMAPAVGAEAASSVYGAFLDTQLSTTNPISLEYIGGYLSTSSELGYTYGVMRTNTLDGGQPDFQANYLRVWRLSQLNEWRIALEVLDPF